MRKEVRLENPPRCRSHLQPPFYIGPANSHAFHVGECLDGAPNAISDSRWLRVSELFRAHRLYLPGNHCSRADRDLEWVHQRGPLDVVRNVLDRMGMGMPGFGTAGVPLEEHAPDFPMATMAAANTNGRRAPTRISRIRRGVSAHGAGPRTSGEDFSCRQSWDSGRVTAQALRATMREYLTEGRPSRSPERGET